MKKPNHQISLPVWPDRLPITTFELIEERRNSRQWHAAPGQNPGELGMVIEAFTCDSCSHARRCELAFDGYNQHGDCLAAK